MPKDIFRVTKPKSAEYKRDFKILFSILPIVAALVYYWVKLS